MSKDDERWVFSFEKVVVLFPHFRNLSGNSWMETKQQQVDKMSPEILKQSPGC